MFVLFLHELNTMSHPNYFHDWKDNSLIKVVTIRIDPKDYLFSMINWSCILFELPICTILFLIQKRRKNTTLNCNLAFHTYPKPIYKLKTMDASCRKKGHIFHFGTSCWPYILFFQTFFQNSGLSTSMKQFTQGILYSFYKCSPKFKFYSHITFAKIPEKILGGTGLNKSKIT